MPAGKTGIPSVSECRPSAGLIFPFQVSDRVSARRGVDRSDRHTW